MQIPTRAAAPLTQSVPAVPGQTMGTSSCIQAMLARDWAATPLGAMAQWLPHLVAILPAVLSSGYSHVLAKNPGHGFKMLPKPYWLDDLAATLDEAIASGQTQRS